MDWWFLPLAFAIGAMIGAVGIGGVLLAPALNLLLGLSLPVAIATAMVSFVFSGLVGTVSYQAKHAIRWSMLPPLLLAVSLSAFFGSFLLRQIPETGLKFALAALMILSGTRELSGRFEGNQPHCSNALSYTMLWVVGLFTGAGSALTATGGPLILVPTMLLLSVQAQVAIGLAQVTQVPIGLMASYAHYLSGNIRSGMVLPVALTVGLGTAAGAFSANLIPMRFLQKLVAIVLIVFGALYLVMGTVTIF